LEGNGCGLIEEITQNFAGEAEENLNKCPSE
jgi:hypothetical protein